MSSKAACPHCGVVIDPAPRANRKCPECREPIAVRTRDGAKLLFTPADAEDYDGQRQREFAANKARRHAANIGVDDAQWAAMEGELAQRFGRPAPAGDVFWGLANRALNDAMATSDWHRMQMIYFSMGLHLKDEGRPFLDIRRESLRCAVRHEIANAARFCPGEPLLRVLGCRPDCEVCGPDDGRIFRASELLDDDAPVPHDCDWCACGIRLESAWWEQHAGSVVETMMAEAPAPPPVRRGLFGRRRRS